MVYYADAQQQLYLTSLSLQEHSEAANKPE